MEYASALVEGWLWPRESKYVNMLPLHGVSMPETGA